MVKNKNKLFELLDKAIQISENFSGGYSGDFLSAEEFHTALKISVDKFKAGDDTQLNNLYIWFAPTCQWDDFVGSNGIELGDEIFNLLCFFINEKRC
jgi:hypothetical protein